VSLGEFNRSGDQFEIPLRPDAEGYIGRECPVKECTGHFKITPGTGLEDPNGCYCPYCGYHAEHDEFYTQAQIEYAKSIVMREVTRELHGMLEGMARQMRSRPGALIQLSARVEPHRPLPLRTYGGKELETEIACDDCTLRFAIYGVYGYCPDCGVHSNLQALRKNAELIEKQLGVAEGAEDPAFAERLTWDALGNCVSAFDGWGRVVVEEYQGKAADPGVLKGMSFQRLTAASTKIQAAFGFDFVAEAGASAFSETVRAFAKRHVISHRLGVVDQKYVDDTGDAKAVVGRKVQISPTEVRGALAVVLRLGEALANHLRRLP